MGFLDFLKGGKKEEEKEAGPASEMGSVGIANVRGEIGKLISRKLEYERGKAKELYSRIRDDFGEVRKLNRELAGKTFESGQRMDAPVNMIKDNYTRKAVSLVGSVPAVSNFEYQEIKDFCSGVDRIMKDMQNIPTRQIVLLSKCFKGETSRIIKKLKEISMQKAGIESVLEGKALWLDWEMNARTDRIFGLLRKTKDLEKQQSILAEKMTAKEKEAKEKERELKEFVKGREFDEFRKLGDNAREVEAERNGIESEIREELTGVKRPLKKLEYESRQKGREKDLVFSRISHSPMKVLFQDQGDSVLRTALIRLRELKLKDNEKERVEELITKIENGYISKLVDRYKWLEGQAKEKKRAEEKSDVPERKKTKERELENLKKEIVEYGREKERTEKHSKETFERIGMEKEELEYVITREINTKMDVTI